MLRYIRPLVGMLAVVVMLGGCIEKQKRAPGAFEIAAGNIAHAADRLAEAAQVTADAVAVINPAAAAQATQAGDALSESAELIADTAELVAASVAVAEDQAEARHEAVIGAIGGVAGVAGTLATGTPAGGAAIQAATVSISQLVYSLLGVFGVTGAGATVMRYRENRAWDEATKAAGPKEPA